MALFYIRTIIILSPLPLKMFASQINVDWSCYIKYSVKTGHWGNSELSRKKSSFAFHFLDMCRTQIMLSSHNDKLMQNMTNNAKLCKKAQIWNKNKPKNPTTMEGTAVFPVFNWNLVIYFIPRYSFQFSLFYLPIKHSAFYAIIKGLSDSRVIC